MFKNVEVFRFLTFNMAKRKAGKACIPMTTFDDICLLMMTFDDI
jgi:hypothetical protein